MGLSYNPSIVVDGLQYALDVANPKCYSGSGNTTFDLTGRVLPGALTNGPTYNSNLGGFLSFDGTNDYLAVPDSNLLDLGANFTISAWIKLNDLSNKAFSGIFGATDVNTNVATLGYYFMWYRDNIYGINAKSLMLQFGKNAWAWNVYSSDTNSINDFNIHHVAVTVSSANTNNPTVSFYIDGVLKNTTWWGSSTKAAINYASDVSSVRVAHVFSPSNTSYYNINGSLNVYNLQVYKRTLSAAEILQNYNANRGRYLYNADIATNGLVYNIDAGNYLSYPTTGTVWNGIGGSGSTYNSVLTNGPTFSGSGSTGVISFDGTNDYATVNTNLLSGYSSGTIAAFIKFSGASPFGTIFLRQHGGVDTYNAFTTGYLVTGYGDRTAGTAGRLYYQNQNNGQKIQSISVLSSNVWYYITLTFSSTNAKIYINGNLDNTVSGNFLSPSDLVTDPRIGSYAGLEYLASSISSFQIYNRALSQAEVIQNYDAFRGRF
jgi:hypothetical protein